MSPHRRLLASAVVAATLAACSSGDRDPAAPPAPTTAIAAGATTTTGPPIAPGTRYVAMGTSYAAGTGIEPQVEGTCSQSERNYPRLLAADLGLDLVDASCGAAIMAHLIDTPQGEHPPLRSSFERLAADLAARAPRATVVLVTYPRMLVDGCDAQGMDADEVRQVAEVGRVLEEASLVFADEVGWAVADPYGDAGDHSACAEDEADRWVDGHVRTTGFPYHPTAAGHDAMARLTIEALAAR